MFLLKILKNLGLIINVLSYINLIASLIANKTSNPQAKIASRVISKIVALLALNFNVTNVSQIDGMPNDDKVTKEIKDIIE